MGIQNIGAGGVVGQIDTVHAAGRMSLRPLDVGGRGGYRLTALSGSIGATLAAAAPLFSFRWGDSSRYAVLHDVQVGAVVNGSITTAVALVLEAALARSSSASDTGGTALTLSGNNGKNKTGFATTLLSDARIATTAALSAGTRTLDTQGFGLALGGTGTTAGAVTPIPMQSIYRPIAGVEHPIVLAQNEGFIVRSVNTGPATGTFQIAVLVTWSEVTSYDNALIT
jgi:hypothetical protein